MHERLIFSLLACAPLAAQSVVSPSQFTTVEGNSGNAYPWISPHRYQEIHGEMRGQTMPIRALSWRRDGNRTDPLQIARALDMELVLAPSDLAAASATFANNYAQAPITVVARRSVNLPDWTQNAGAPAPFDHTIPLDQLYPHAGTHDLLWEAVIHASSANRSNYFADAFSGSDQNQGTSRDVGTACTIQGNPRPFRVSSEFTTTLSTRTLRLAWSASMGNPNQPSALLIGLTNPDLPVPGLCTRLYVDPLVVVNAVAGSAGELSFGSVTVGFLPRMVGTSLFAQAASLDPLQQGIPVAMSAGSEGIVPSLPPASSPVCRVFAFANPNATSGSLVRGQCLVTRFAM